MYIQIESNMWGHVLIGLSYILVVFYLGLLIGIDQHGKSRMAEEMAIIERLRESQKFLAKEPECPGDSFWKILK